MTGMRSSLLGTRANREVEPHPQDVSVTGGWGWPVDSDYDLWRKCAGSGGVQRP